MGDFDFLLNYSNPKLTLVLHGFIGLVRRMLEKSIHVKFGTQTEK